MGSVSVLRPSIPASHFVVHFMMCSLAAWTALWIIRNFFLMNLGRIPMYIETEVERLLFKPPYLGGE